MPKIFLILSGILIMLLSIKPAFSFTIQGQIRDKKTKELLSGANIFLEGTRFGTMTDRKGHYRLNPPVRFKGPFTLIVSYVGYYDILQKIRLPLKSNLIMNFALKPSLLSLDQIVVTGTRSERFLKDSPVTTQVIKGADLRETGSENIADILNEVTGITIKHNIRFGSGIDLQGFDSNHILLLIDGMKTVGRLNGHLDLSQFDASQIKRIEIVKGATSAIYGSQAMGGVINIITNKPASKSELNVDLRAGSYGRLDGIFSVNTPLAGWLPRISLASRRFGGYDLDKKTATQDGRSFRKYDASFSLMHKFKKSIHLDLQSSYFQEEQQRTLNRFFNEKVTNDRLSAQVRAKIDSLFPFQLKAGLSFSRYHHHYGEIVRSSNFFKESDSTTNELLSGDLLLIHRLAGQLFNLGYSYESETIESPRVENNRRFSSLHSLFFQDEVKPLKNTTLLVGGRWDRHSIYGSQFSPKVSLMFIFRHNCRLRLSYGRGFRAPSFKELYFNLHVNDVNLTVLGNPALKPEHSQSVNMDWELWNNDNYHVRLNFFYNQIVDLISDVRINSAQNDLRYTYRNFSKAKTWGGEWDMKYFPKDWLELTLGYNYLDSREESSGLPLSGRIKRRAHGGLLLDLPFQSKLNLRALYFGKRESRLIDDATGKVSESIPIKDYLLLNANISVRLPYQIRWYGGVKNLTNYVNKTWGPMPGREWYTGFSFKL